MIFNIGGVRPKEPEPDVSTIMPEFTYTGSSRLINDGKSSDGTQNWRIKFLTSGRLVFTKAVEALTVFLVGGGGSGGGQGGGGGGGGYTHTANVTISAGAEYDIVVGEGGVLSDGGASSAFGFRAEGGKIGGPFPRGYGGDGGSGGGGEFGYGGANGADGETVTAYDETNAGGKGQWYTTREFGELNGTLYAGGGAGTVHSDDTIASGGAGGGGSTGQSGKENTGGGGGAEMADGTGENGSGGSGIVVLRNRRTW